MFKNAVSCGHFCSVASELERMGYRSFSLPFDWIITRDILTVISLIENHFKSFLSEENLVQESYNPKHYRDKTNGISYLHDFNAEQPLSVQLPSVQKKYARRINRFYETIIQPTLFIRYCMTSDEIDYVTNNKSDIDKFFQQFNPQNQIVYVCDSTIATDQFVNMGGYVVKEGCRDAGLSKFLRQLPELEKYLRSNLDLKTKDRLRNRVVHWQKEGKKKVRQARNDVLKLTRLSHIKQ